MQTRRLSHPAAMTAVRMLARDRLRCVVLLAALVAAVGFRGRVSRVRAEVPRLVSRAVAPVVVLPVVEAGAEEVEVREREMQARSVRMVERTAAGMRRGRAVVAPRLAGGPRGPRRRGGESVAVALLTAVPQPWGIRV